MALAEEALASLEGVRSPEGMPLPGSGMHSDVVAGVCKELFSIAVDAAEVRDQLVGAAGAGAAPTTVIGVWSL